MENDAHWKGSGFGDYLSWDVPKDVDCIKIVVETDRGAVATLHLLPHQIYRDTLQSLYKEYTNAHTEVTGFTVVPVRSKEVFEITLDKMDEHEKLPGGWVRLKLFEVEEYGKNHGFDEMAVIDELMFMTDDYIEVEDYAIKLDWIQVNGKTIPVDRNVLVYVR